MRSKLAVIVIVLLVAASSYSHFATVHTTNPFLQMSGPTMIGSLHSKVGKTVDYIYDVSNVSRQELILERVEFGARVPVHVKLVHSGVVLGASFFTTYGWPPVQYGSSLPYRVVELAGYALPPNGHAAVVVAFVASAVGAYTVGPLTVYGKMKDKSHMVSFMGDLRAEATLPQYAFMCVGLRKSECDRREHREQARLKL